MVLTCNDEKEKCLLKMNAGWQFRIATCALCSSQKRITRKYFTSLKKKKKNPKLVWNQHQFHEFIKFKNLNFFFIITVNLKWYHYRTSLKFFVAVEI